MSARYKQCPECGEDCEWGKQRCSDCDMDNEAVDRIEAIARACNDVVDTAPSFWAGVKLHVVDGTTIEETKPKVYVFGGRIVQSHRGRTIRK